METIAVPFVAAFAMPKFGAFIAATKSEQVRENIPETVVEDVVVAEAADRWEVVALDMRTPSSQSESPSAPLSLESLPWS
jgi:hypothetical protein